MRGGGDGQSPRTGSTGRRRYVVFMKQGVECFNDTPENGLIRVFARRKKATEAPPEGRNRPERRLFRVFFRKTPERISRLPSLSRPQSYIFRRISTKPTNCSQEPNKQAEIPLFLTKCYIVDKRTGSVRTLPEAMCGVRPEGSRVKRRHPSKHDGSAAATVRGARSPAF